MNNNHDEKKEKAEEAFINNLFEKKEKDQNEQLYKNEFFILEEDIKANKSQNSLQFMHDILLNKLMLEDYVPFPPKNEEPIIASNQKEEKKKEDDQDKLIEEENEFLRSLHKINYLTFSPFGLSFFDENNKDKNNINEDLAKEREEKILHMIDFNYDNFEVTNDLLLNICQGFVDINKLKEENLTKNKEKEKEKQKQKEAIMLNNAKEESKQKESSKSETDNYDKSELEFYNEIAAKSEIPFYKDFITPCKKEYKAAKTKAERSEIESKWKQKIIEKDKEYEKYLREMEEKQRKEKEEQRRLREIELKKEREMEEERKNNERLMKAFEDIIKQNNKKNKANRSQNKSNTNKNARNNQQIKARNKSTNMSLKKKTKGTRSSMGVINAGNHFNIATKLLKNNVSKSQPKIKTNDVNNNK